MYWRFSREKREGRQLAAKLVKAGTVLYLNSDWIAKFSLEVYPVDSTEKFHIFRKLKVVNVTVEEFQGWGRDIGVQGITVGFRLRSNLYFLANHVLVVFLLQRRVITKKPVLLERLRLMLKI